MSLFNDLLDACSNRGPIWVLKRAPGYAAERFRLQIDGFIHPRFSDHPRYWQLSRRYDQLSILSERVDVRVRSLQHVLEK